MACSKMLIFKLYCYVQLDENFCVVYSDEQYFFIVIQFFVCSQGYRICNVEKDSR